MIKVKDVVGVVVLPCIILVRHVLLAFFECVARFFLLGSFFRQSPKSSLFLVALMGGIFFALWSPPTYSLKVHLHPSVCFSFSSCCHSPWSSSRVSFPVVVDEHVLLQSSSFLRFSSQKIGQRATGSLKVMVPPGFVVQGWGGY